MQSVWRKCEFVPEYHGIYGEPLQRLLRKVG